MQISAANFLSSPAPLRSSVSLAFRSKHLPLNSLSSVGADKKFSAVPVPADPKRLAVLEYSVIENLQVLGLSDRIKAAVQTRNLPWLTALPADCKLVKSVKSVDIETVSSAKPDLIFISGRISRNIDAFKPIAPPSA